MNCRLAHALDRDSVGSFVVSHFFDCRAHQNASVTARHQINFGSANYVTQQVTRFRGETQHLSLYRAWRERMRWQLTRPCSCTIHYDGG